MTGGLLLDIDIVIDCLRSRREAIAYLEALTANLDLAVISVAELFTGVKGSEEERALGQLLGVCDILPATKKIARLGGALRKEYGKSHGTSLADALIAATAHDHGTELVILNQRHFSMTANKPPPYGRCTPICCSRRVDLVSRPIQSRAHGPRFQ